MDLPSARRVLGRTVKRNSRNAVRPWVVSSVSFFVILLFISLAQADLTTGLVGFWKFDETSGNAVLDSSGQGNNGALSGTVSRVVTGEAGGALDFSGLSGVVTIPRSASLNNLPQFTYAAWVNPRSMGGGYSGGGIVSKGSRTMWSSASSGQGVYAEALTSSLNVYMATPGDALDLNAWQLIVFTVDMAHTSSMPGTIYKNGLIQTSVLGAGTAVADDVTDLLIGHALGPDRPFDGLIDEVRLYNRVLSPQDVADLYNLYTGDHVVADIIPPAITGLAARNITNAGASIQWTTDDLSNSWVDYGPTQAYGKSTVQVYSNNLNVRAHLVDLASLEPGTLYHYRVKSTDPSGNTATSADQTFSTLAGALSVAPVFPLVSYEGPTMPIIGMTDGLGHCGLTFPYEYGIGQGAVTLDPADSVDGLKSARLDLTSGRVDTNWLTYNYDNCPGAIGLNAPDQPRAYIRQYADNPSGWQFNTYNRFSFWIKSGTNGPAMLTNGSSNIQLGTYVRNVAMNVTSESEIGGNHYYHFINIPPTDTWTKVVFNARPNHVRGGWFLPNGVPVSTILHPTGEVDRNYWDAFVTFYLEYMGLPTSYPYVAKYDAFQFYTEPYAEDDDNVYTLQATYAPAANRLIVNWSRGEVATHEVRYAFQNIHQIGWNAAIAAPNGLVPPLNGSLLYNAMLYDNSTLPLQGKTGVYIAIKSQNSPTLFSQIYLPLNLPLPAPTGNPNDPVIPPAGPNSIPVPDLSGLPKVLPVNAEMSFSYPVSGVSFQWSLTPLSSSPAGLGGLRSAGMTAGGMASTTSVPRFNLSSLSLSPGRYTLTVTVSNGAQTQSASATLTLVNADFSALKVYPNPWRKDKHATKNVTFANLPAGSTIKLFTVSGHLVKEYGPPATGNGTASWDLTNDSGDKVASGVYVYLIMDGQGNKVKGKVAVIK